MYELTVKAEFEAAHRIENYLGKCARLHGHNWVVEAVASGRELDSLGMLIDFKILKAKLNEVLDELDHRYLNELEIFSEQSPTAENIAREVFDKLAATEIFDERVKLKAIKVFESPKSCVKYSADE